MHMPKGQTTIPSTPKRLISHVDGRWMGGKCSEGEVAGHAGSVQDIVPDGCVERCQVKGSRVRQSSCSHARSCRPEQQ